MIFIRNNGIIIICITVILAVLMICSTVLYVNFTKSPDELGNVSVNESNNTNDSSNTSASNSGAGSTYSHNLIDDDTDGYMDGHEITFRNKNFLGEDSGIEQFSTDEKLYIKNKKTGDIAERKLDSDGAYRYYDIKTGKCVLG